MFAIEFDIDYIATFVLLNNTTGNGALLASGYCKQAAINVIKIPETPSLRDIWKEIEIINQAVHNVFSLGRLFVYRHFTLWIYFHMV